MQSSKILLKDGNTVDLVDGRIDDGDIASWNNKPNVTITSENDSVNISTSVDAETNTKTFDLSVDSLNITSSDGSINVSTSEGVTDLTLPGDVVRDSAYTHIDASTANPLMNGTAAVGVSTKYAREDHVHPSDTSREDIANKTTVVLGMSDSKYPTDKAVAEFVNSSIATNTANYISNNGNPFTSVEQLNTYTGTVTNNDYAFINGIDSDGNTYYDRYKATVKGSNVTWSLEYRLNNSSFTAAQWSAINSGITSVLVAKIHTHSNKDVLDGITSTDIDNWNSKMDNQSVGNVSEPIYLENGIAKVATNVATTGNLDEKLNVDGSNATTLGVTAMMQKVASGSSSLSDYSYYFGDSNADHTHIVRRPILDIWNYFAPKVNDRIVAKLGSVGSENKPIYLENGVPKVCNDKLNVDGSNATTEGVTTMLKTVPVNSSELGSTIQIFSSTPGSSEVSKRPIGALAAYIKNDIGSAGSVDKPIYLENGVPKVCADGVPYSEVSSGGSVGYGVFVGGAHNLAYNTRCYCTFLVTVASSPYQIAHTYIGTFTFRGKTLKSELRCLTGIPAYPLRIVVVSNVAGKDSNGNPTYNVGLYVIPADKTYIYSKYNLTRIASTSDFIWDVKKLSDAEYDACDGVSKNAYMTQTAIIKDVANTSKTDTNTVHIYYDDIICNNGTKEYTINISRLVIGKTYRFHIMKENQAATYLYNYGETSSGTVHIYAGDSSTSVTQNVRFALNGSGSGTSDHTVTVARMTETQIYVIWGY